MIGRAVTLLPSIFGADTLGNTFKYGDTAPYYNVGFSNEVTVGPILI